MAALDTITVLFHLIRTRYCLSFRRRDRLLAWQAKGLKTYLRKIVPRTWPAFSPVGQLQDLPVMNKSIIMENFAYYNQRHIPLEQAYGVARQAEMSRDFSPQLDDLTVGLSSGTSGQQGVFLVSRHERLKWAGVLLGRALPTTLLKRLLNPFGKVLRIAFFLRANSNLYTTLSSRRIAFHFFDLVQGVPPQLSRLHALGPEILVAPPTVLLYLATLKNRGECTLQPLHIVSVAEVLHTHDRAFIEAAFGMAVHQLYQATEGFLAYTCERQGLHLNEAFVHIEPDWIDSGHTRFQPIITDFSRETQLIVRYRLNDVLQLAPMPCPCGRAERTLAAIEGRTDEILWMHPTDSHAHGAPSVPLFPDLIRRAMTLVEVPFTEYTITQSGTVWTLATLPNAGIGTSPLREAITKAIVQLCEKAGCLMPDLQFIPWQAPPPGAKCIRIRQDPTLFQSEIAP